jgi:hypothetical protein
VAIQPLFNAFRQQVGQMLVASHAVSLVVAIQIDKPVQIGDKKLYAAIVLSNLYAKEKSFLNLYCTAPDP